MGRVFSTLVRVPCPSIVPSRSDCRLSLSIRTDFIGTTSFPLRLFPRLFPYLSDLFSPIHSYLRMAPQKRLDVRSVCDGVEKSRKRAEKGTVVPEVEEKKSVKLEAEPVAEPVSL